MVPVKNQEYIVKIIDLNFEGIGVAKINGFPIFIENSLINEEVKIKIIKVLKNYAIGIVIEFISMSKDRVEIKDKKGTWVGTMPLQHLSYEKQLILKQKQVKNVMNKIAKMPHIPVLKTIGCKDELAYRNKAQIPVRSINGILETGFYRKNTHTLIPIEDFMIQDKRIDEVILIVRDILRKLKIQAYDEENHSGLVRHICVRRGIYSKEVQIVIVAMKYFDLIEDIKTELLKRCEDVKSIVLNINSKQTNVIMGSENILIYGEDKIQDSILGYHFNISSKSFYQVNPKQTEVLYSKAIELADLKDTDVVLDAYCGIGTIGICIANKVKQVYGMEIVEDAIKMAEENAQLNHISNITFEAGDAKDVMEKWNKIHFDVLIVDPPRKGLDKKFILESVKVNPKKIVYISCNPATMARDLAIYEELGYETQVVQPVDMFPQTAHVETVVCLGNKNVRPKNYVEIGIDAEEYYRSKDEKIF